LPIPTSGLVEVLAFSDDVKLPSPVMASTEGEIALGVAMAAE
jgi:hypothetical protein